VSDIVDWLRVVSDSYGMGRCEEALEEIERLREALNSITKVPRNEAACKDNPPAKADVQERDVSETEYVLVPREPTEAMYVKGDEKIIEFLNSRKFIANESTPAIECYRAMIAAAPPLTAQPAP
jgi:hypothetical protein